METVVNKVRNAETVPANQHLLSQETAERSVEVNFVSRKKTKKEVF